MPRPETGGISGGPSSPDAIEDPDRFRVEVHGRINNQPDSLIIDFREMVEKDAELRGEEVSDEELDRRAQEHVDFHRRLDKEDREQQSDPGEPQGRVARGICRILRLISK